MFPWNRSTIQRKSWSPRKLWPCYCISVSVVPFLYQLFDVFDNNTSRNSNHYAGADFISVFSIFFFWLLPFKLFRFLIEKLFQTVFRMFASLLCLIVWRVYRHNKMQKMWFLWFFLGKTLWNILFGYLKCWVVEMG